MMDSALDRTAAGCTEVSEIAMTNEVTRVILKAIEDCVNDGLGIGDDWVRDDDVRGKIPCFADAAGKED
jgi:hypothetical protein